MACTSEKFHFGETSASATRILVELAKTPSAPSATSPRQRALSIRERKVRHLDAPPPTPASHALHQDARPKIRWGDSSLLLCGNLERHDAPPIRHMFSEGSERLSLNHGHFSIHRSNHCG